MPIASPPEPRGGSSSGHRCGPGQRCSAPALRRRFFLVSLPHGQTPPSAKEVCGRGFHGTRKAVEGD